MPDVEKLLNAIDAAEQYSFGSDEDSELQSDRARAIDYYLGRNIDPAPEGRSQVVDRSVFETIHWILPSLCRIFANGDDVVELVPFGPEDEEQAKQESDYLNYLVTQKNRWFETCLTWFQDALQTKNAYCLAFMDESVQVEKERYEFQSEESIALLTQEPGVEVIGFEQFPDEESSPQPMIDPITGQPVLDEMGQPVLQPRMLFNIEIRRKKPKRKLTFRVLPPERVKVSENTPSHTLEECDYFEYWEMKTLSQLRADGFDVPDDIASDEDLDTEEDNARDQFEEDFVRFDERPADPSMRRVKARTIWIRHDYDEDGIAELQRVLRVGREILFREEESRIPVACIVPYPNPHRHPGLSVADIVADIQRIKTAILRGGLDNLYQANSPRTVINDLINLDDMLVSRPGGVVRSEGDGPVEGNFAVIATPNIFPQAMEGLEYMDRIRESRTGVSRQFAGIENDALLEAKSATEVSQLSTMAAQRVEQIARIFASGIEHLFSVAHELVIKHGHQAEVVKLRGKWVQVDPSSWKTGRDMRIVVGYGAGNKDALASRLLVILNAQKEAIAGGLRVANEANVYEALVELTKASDFTAPQRFWTDPRTLPPPEPPADPIQVGAQIEAEKIQSNERTKAAEIDSNERVKAAEFAHKERLAEFDGRLKIALEEIKKGNSVDLEKLKGDIKNEPQRLETQKIVAESQAAQKEMIERLKAELREAIESIAQSLVERIEAPREIIRDNRGRPTGIRMNGIERTLRRDAQGRVQGLQ